MLRILVRRSEIVVGFERARGCIGDVYRWLA